MGLWRGDATCLVGVQNPITDHRTSNIYAQTCVIDNVRQSPILPHGLLVVVLGHRFHPSNDIPQAVFI